VDVVFTDESIDTLLVVASVGMLSEDLLNRELLNLESGGSGNSNK
jgi:hypothetical protein